MPAFHIEVHEAESAHETREFIKNLKKPSTKALVIVGGDGTLNTLLPAILKSKIPVIPFPAGTANDFARQNEWTAEPELVLNALLKLKTKSVDVLQVNKVPFLTVGGFGIGSELTGMINNYREKYGWFRLLWRRYKSKAYSLVAVKKILTSRTFLNEVRIETDDFMEDIQTSSVFVCNQCTLGGNILAYSDATPDDGKFEIVVTAANKRLELINSLLKSKTRLGVSNSYVLSTDSCKITSIKGNPIKVFGDGEIILEANVLRFSVKPSAIKVILPAEKDGKKA